MKCRRVIWKRLQPSIKKTAFDKIKQYLVSGPLTYMEALFSGMLGDEGKARQTAFDFYGPIFLLYSIYDGTEDKSQVIKLLEEHMDHFLQEMQIS